MTELLEAFEQSFEDMFADVWFDERDRALASEEGIGDFEAGDNTLHSLDALILIRKYDRVLRQDHYRAKRNRLAAQRGSIINAFGPEMLARLEA